MTWTSVLSALSTMLSAFAIPGGVLALATVAAGVLLILLVTHVHGGYGDSANTPGQIMAAGLRDRSRRTARLRLRDPDSAGRTRPRAPSPAPAA